jgi:hypothetical protein
MPGSGDTERTISSDGWHWEPDTIMDTQGTCVQVLSDRESVTESFSIFLASLLSYVVRLSLSISYNSITGLNVMRA